MEVLCYKYFQQFIMNLDDTDFKTPQKQQLSKSPITINKQSSPKKAKEEIKKIKIIKKLEFNDDQLVIRQDGILGRSKRITSKENKVNSSYTLGLLNSIELNQNNVIVNKLVKPSDDELFNLSRDENIVCKCRKSKCIQNYCVCSANNQECSFKCECYNCSNKQPKSAISKQSGSEYLGCNCRKQDCSKGYCECQKRKIKCTSKCRCCDECKNCDIQPLPFHLDSLF
ncbi:unnamed protein product (macronuclear) [Paramecium tetraurelia]|uniref:CRC domain-containing protein n=1 Tax=Paramecium tetraurelia TaxID=5888 RepID=A0D6Z1_PARTE|nr:uncharacterized protein GSPATT00001849001 [Paramecium tetraurelia]CAK78808.1 unnamed protein product [Paramecium tetraurelia]|eukprot:XP_001446205.1 hypothetical protein (macronuclear) [Paramecium tetraurelia strain d4-2]